MANNLVHRIDMPSIYESGIIMVADMLYWMCECPVPFRYQLYYSPEKNISNLLKVLDIRENEEYEFSPRFASYLEDRKSLFEKVSNGFIKLIYAIQNSDLNDYDKRALTREVDLCIYKLYPYVPPWDFLHAALKIEYLFWYSIFAFNFIILELQFQMFHLLYDIKHLLHLFQHLQKLKTYRYFLLF